jgi:uncharacterized protein YjiS (DUF1127 family)
MSYHRRISLGRVQRLNLSTATSRAYLPHPLVLALRRVLRRILPRGLSRGVGILRLESLNEHLLRDIGLTSHVEQPLD